MTVADASTLAEICWTGRLAELLDEEHQQHRRRHQIVDDQSTPCRPYATPFSGIENL